MGIFCCCLGSCFGTGSSRSIEVLLIVVHSVSTALIILSLATMKWKEIYSSNLYFFIIMLIISIICLLFAILIRIWRAQNLIKNVKRNTGMNLCTTSLVLVVIHFILCIIEEIIFSISYQEVNFPCSDYDNDDYYYYRRLNSNVDCRFVKSNYDTKIIPFYQYFIVYVTLTYLEVVLILKMCVWYLLRTRVYNGLDHPLDTPIINNVVPPVNYAYPGRTVVVIQQPYQNPAGPYVYGPQIYSVDANSNNQRSNLENK